MLRITIELVPLGVEAEKETLCTAKIWNDTTGTKTRGNYKFRFSQCKSNRTWRKGQHQGFLRQRHGAWRLLYECLKQIYE